MPEASLTASIISETSKPKKNFILGLCEMVYSAFLLLEYFLFLCVSVHLVHAVCMYVHHAHVVCLACILCLHFIYLCTTYMKHMCLCTMYIQCVYICVPCACIVYVLHVHKVCMSVPCAYSTLRGQKKALYILELES